MIFLFLLPFYLGVSSYMMFRFFYWMKHCNHRFNWLRFKVPFAVVYLFMALSPVIAFLLPKSAVAIVIRRISTYWIGIMLYSLLYVVLFDLLRLIAKHTKLKNTPAFFPWKRYFHRLGGCGLCGGDLSLRHFQCTKHQGK